MSFWIYEFAQAGIPLIELYEHIMEPTLESRAHV